MDGGIGGITMSPGAEEGGLTHGADDAVRRRSEGLGFVPAVNYTKPSAKPLERHAGGCTGGVECRGPCATTERGRALLVLRSRPMEKVSQNGQRRAGNEIGPHRGQPPRLKTAALTIRRYCLKKDGGKPGRVTRKRSTIGKTVAGTRSGRTRWRTLR